MKAYSKDLRTRVVQAVDKQLGTRSEVAELFGVSQTFVKKLLRQRRETNCLDPKPHGGGRAPAIKGEVLELLRKRVTEQPDATLEELRRYVAEHSGVNASAATICRARQRLGIPQKKFLRRPGPKISARS